jgi:hypothetical protein
VFSTGPSMASLKKDALDECPEIYVSLFVLLSMCVVANLDQRNLELF